MHAMQSRAINTAPLTNAVPCNYCSPVQLLQLRAITAAPCNYCSPVQLLQPLAITAAPCN